MNTTSAPQLTAAITASALAQDLSAEQVAVLAARMSCETFEAGAVLAAEGSADTRVYSIVDGQLGVVKDRGTPEEALLLTLGKGDLVHELGFLDGNRRYASLVARSALTVLVLERDALEALLDSQPRIVWGVLRGIVRSVHRVQMKQAQQAAELTNYIVKQHGRY